MDKILVHGGRRLSGSIKVSGSKNSSLPILAATLLTREPCVVHGVPDLSDTNYMLQILTHLGAHVERASGTVLVGRAPAPRAPDLLLPEVEFRHRRGERLGLGFVSVLGQHYLGSIGSRWRVKRRS